MVARIVLVLRDQFSLDLSALKKAQKARDVVVMAEVVEATEYVRNHPKKIALIIAAMRKFAQALEGEGWDDRYTRRDNPGRAGSIVGEVPRRAEETKASGVICTEPGEWRLINKLKPAPLKTHIPVDNRFIASHAEFEDWAEGRKALRMENFYREMRRKTGLLREGGKPAGGKWNFDHDNRNPAPGDVEVDWPLTFEPDAVVEEVLGRVETRMHCIKLLGQSLMATDFNWQVAEIQIRIAALNRHTALGIPLTEAVG